MSKNCDSCANKDCKSCGAAFNLSTQAELGAKISPKKPGVLKTLLKRLLS